jgi:Ras-related protein Rab-8A
MTTPPRPISQGNSSSGSGGGGGATTPLKVLIVGNSNTGKSCLTLRFVDETFTQSFVPTIGIDFHVKTLDVDR